MIWALTFLVHSTLWFGLVWLWLRLRPQTQPGVREALWYAAILASLVAPTLQALAAGHLSLWTVSVPSALVAVTELEHGPTSQPAWVTIGVRIWLGIAGTLALLHLGRLAALRRRLGNREEVEDRRIQGILTDLCETASVGRVPRLTESDDLSSPVALGTGARAEICLPTRAAFELDDQQLRALLGHELAHHLRRDAIRLGVLNALEVALFFHPLLPHAIGAIRHAAEEQCDDWAASQVSDRLAMASCLAEVAAWAPKRDCRLPVPCMARSRPLLGTRITRLMNEANHRQARPHIWLAAGLIAMLALAPLLAPAVAPRGEHMDGAVGEHSARSEHREEGSH